jgi:hypothetical protein
VIDCGPIGRLVVCLLQDDVDPDILFVVCPGCDGRCPYTNRLKRYSTNTLSPQASAAGNPCFGGLTYLKQP